MYQFFVGEDQVYRDEIHIYGPDVNHIRNVLRMKTGTRIRVSAEDGKSWFCSISSLEEDLVKAAIIEEDTAGTELPIKITLYQGLPKSEKMELIIQKSVELGVHDIVPVSMKNCVMKLDEKKVDARIKRWQAISESAAKQSKRTCIPEIHRPMTFALALQDALEKDILLVPYENQRGMEATREVLSAIRPGQSVGIIIGPEGGFAVNEIQKIKEVQEIKESVDSCKVCILSLGKRILRTETAGPAALAMLVYQLDQ